MNTKIILIIIVAIVLVSGGFWFYFNQFNKQPEIIGGDVDEYGCKTTAGYTWCEAKQKCLRIWEESCEEENNNELPLSSYALILVQSMQQDVEQIRQINVINKKYMGNEKMLSVKIDEQYKKYEKAKKDIYSSFGITEEEWSIYMAKNRNEIDNYINGNPGLKAQMDDSEKQLENLINELDLLLEKDF